MDFEMLNKIAMKLDPLPEKDHYELNEDQNYLVTEFKEEDNRIILALNAEFQIILPDRISRAINSNYELYIRLTENVQRYNLFIEYHGGARFQFSV